MPIPNSKSLPSLKGVFPGVLPKPKRNFLKENKLKIREIQTKQSIPPDKFSKGSSRFEKRVSSSSARSNCMCPCNCSGDEQIKIAPQAGGRGHQGCVTKTIKVCDQEIQTEEINDEHFLLSSLKKCTSNEVQSLVLKENEYDDFVDDDGLSQHFNNIDINHNGMNSERTNRSTATRISMGSKSKRDIKLPKYLEKEKREKEEKRLKEELKDPNCPPGHYALLDAEKDSCLKAAEKKYQQLLNEFNRLPFASETLKLRSKKMDIEKNLVELENDIKIFSKPVVYMKLNTK